MNDYSRDFSIRTSHLAKRKTAEAPKTWIDNDTCDKFDRVNFSIILSFEQKDR